MGTGPNAFNASTYPIIRLQDWNDLLAQMDKGFSYIVRKNGEYYEAIKGGTSSDAGKVTYGGSGNAGGTSGLDCAAVIQKVFDNAPETTTVKLGDSLSIGDTVTLSRRINAIIDQLIITDDVDGLVIDSGAAAATLHINEILFPNSYTHSAVTLEDTSSVRLHVNRLFVTPGGMATGNSVGIKIYGKTIAGCFYNYISFTQIGAIGTGISLLTTADSCANANHIYGGWVWACDTGVKLVNNNGEWWYGHMGGNVFRDLTVDGATKMTCGVYISRAMATVFDNFNHVDMGAQTVLNAISSSSYFHGGLLEPTLVTGSDGAYLYIYNNRLFITEHEGSANASNGDWIDHSLSTTPSSVVVSVNASGADAYVSDRSATQFRIGLNAGTYLVYFFARTIPVYYP